MYGACVAPDKKPPNTATAVFCAVPIISSAIPLPKPDTNRALPRVFPSVMVETARVATSAPTPTPTEIAANVELPDPISSESPGKRESKAIVNPQWTPMRERTSTSLKSDAIYLAASTIGLTISNTSPSIGSARTLGRHWILNSWYPARRKNTDVSIKTQPVPSSRIAIMTPPKNGPITLDPCLAIPRNDTAESRCSLGTRLGIIASEAGVTADIATPCKTANTTMCHIVTAPDSVSTARTNETSAPNNAEAMAI